MLMLMLLLTTNGAHSDRGSYSTLAMATVEVDRVFLLKKFTTVSTMMTLNVENSERRIVQKQITTCHQLVSTYYASW
jgi:hypothetical protein